MEEREGLEVSPRPKPVEVEGTSSLVVGVEVVRKLEPETRLVVVGVASRHWQEVRKLELEPLAVVVAGRPSLEVRILELELEQRKLEHTKPLAQERTLEHRKRQAPERKKRLEQGHKKLGQEHKTLEPFPRKLRLEACMLERTQPLRKFKEQ